MRILSVRQPWASLIAEGQKTIELRSWVTKYRGPLLVIAGSIPTRGTSFSIFFRFLLWFGFRFLWYLP